MNEFVVKRDSWHYKLADSFHGYSKTYNGKDLPKDFCTYWRQFAIAGFVVGGLLSLAGGIVGFFAYKIVTSPYEFFIGVAALVILIAAVLAIIGAVYGIGAGYEKVTKRAAQREPGIFLTKVQSWKKSICPMLRYE